MADEERPDDGPSLELPSFGLRRKRRRPPSPEPPEVEASPPEPSEVEVRAPAPEVEVRAPASHETSQPGPEPAAESQPGARKAKVKKERRPGGYPASALTGVIVGALMVAMTWGALNGCEAVRGTSSCGRPGFAVLALMLVVAVVIGGVLLRALRVRDPGSTSFLGVGLVTVVALLAFIDVIYDWWMFLAIPGVALISFALAHAVTSAFVDTGGDDRRR